MNSGDKLKAMLLIWGAAIILSVILFSDKPVIGLGEGVLGFLLFAGLIGGTIAISQADDTTPNREQKPLVSVESEKLKREDTHLIDRLVESMDDDERAALLRRLGVPEEFSLADDGELRKH